MRTTESGDWSVDGQPKAAGINVALATAVAAVDPEQLAALDQIADGDGSVFDLAQ